MKLKILLGLMLIAPFAFSQDKAEEKKSKHELYFEPAISTNHEFGSMSNSLYVAYSYELNKTWKFIGDIGGKLSTKTLDNADWKAEHSLLRLRLSRKDFFTFYGSSYGLDARWSAPTTSGQQEIGTFGTLTFRFPNSGKYTDKISYLFRPSVNFGLVKNGYSNKLTEVKDDKTKIVKDSFKAGNKLASVVFEYLVAFELGHNFTIAPYANFSAGTKMPSRVLTGDGDEDWKEEFGVGYEVELIYTVNKKLSLAVNVSESTSFDGDFNVKLFQGDKLSYALEAGYTY